MDYSESTPQNIYDHENFLEKFLEKFGKSKEENGWGIQMLSSLPKSVKGMDILELGAGDGFTMKYLVEQGAASVTGYDISEKMITLAKNMNENNNNVIAEVKDLETLQLPEQQYDLVVSFYTFHYIFNYKSIMETIVKSLKQGGKLVIVMEHPIYTASIEQPIWIERPSGDRAWPVSNYFIEGKRIRNWIDFEGVVKYHRTLSTYIQTPIGLGLNLTHLEEFCPSDQQILKNPEQIDNFIRPLVLNLCFTK
ncbi:hypothetical protein CYY_004064 [Polysphondylium violaceum]|uniref:Methyltransferase type 11 domain-containing protein n=1 Tax=Polysphondylium violaceum TaxID=133409 RepID=A0A8J4UZL5_9MYCE|nr:hypothetical protein CYY_004064 [Polysphondylium violaceum]